MITVIFTIIMITIVIIILIIVYSAPECEFIRSFENPVLARNCWPMCKSVILITIFIDRKRRSVKVVSSGVLKVFRYLADTQTGRFLIRSQASVLRTYCHHAGGMAYYIYAFASACQYRKVHCTRSSSPIQSNLRLLYKIKKQARFIFYIIFLDFDNKGTF